MKITKENLNLEGFKKGAEVVVITLKNGKIEFGRIATLKEFDEKIGKWRAEKGFPIPKDGLGYYAMHKCSKPHYYYSAHPEILAAAKAEFAHRKKVREIKKKEAVARHAEFMQKFNALLEEYGAEIYATQTSGDDQGVEFEIYVDTQECSTELK